MHHSFASASAATAADWNSFNPLQSIPSTPSRANPPVPAQRDVPTAVFTDSADSIHGILILPLPRPTEESTRTELFSHSRHGRVRCAAPT